MKPRMDAGGIGFHLCESEEDIRQAFSDLYSQKSCFGEVPETPDVLIQEYISGKEIVINHVSHNGIHEVTDVWAYSKNGATYSYIELINVLTDEYSDAIRYTEKALDALGITYGPSHSEIMLTEKGPLLIETGARPMGHMTTCALSEKVFGHSVIEKIIHSYAYPVDLQDKTYPGYRFSDFMYYTIFMRSFTEGPITGLPVENILSKCRYVKNIRLQDLKESMFLFVTTNLTNSPGSFDLLDADESKLKEWIRIYTLIEKEYPHILYRFDKDTPLSDKETELIRQLTEV